MNYPFPSPLHLPLSKAKKMIHHITHKNPFKLQSPAPICMFYLSHPFGVVSPSSGSDAFKSRTFSSYPGRDDQIVSGDNDDGDGNDALYQRRRRKQLGEKPVVLNRTNARRREDWSGNLTGCNHDARTTSGLRDSSRMRSGHLIPWPRDTWRREFVLPPLIQFRGKQKGKWWRNDYVELFCVLYDVVNKIFWGRVGRRIVGFICIRKAIIAHGTIAEGWKNASNEVGKDAV